MFVIWDWNWIDEDSSTETPDNLSASNSLLPSASNSPPPSSDSNASQSDDDDMIPAITQTMIFKYIGTHKEKRYQEILAIASKKHENGIKVPVKLLPEPGNKYDNKTIAFMCQINDSNWERIGYVVREALDELHEAVNNGNILNVSFDWIKYPLQDSRVVCWNPHYTKWRMVNKSTKKSCSKLLLVVIDESTHMN